MKLLGGLHICINILRHSSLTRFTTLSYIFPDFSVLLPRTAVVKNVHVHHARLCLTLLNTLVLRSPARTSGKHLSLLGRAADVQVGFPPVQPTTASELPRGAPPPPGMAAEPPPAARAQGFQGRCKRSNSCLCKPRLTSSAAACGTKMSFELVPVRNPVRHLPHTFSSPQSNHQIRTPRHSVPNFQVRGTS